MSTAANICKNVNDQRLKDLAAKTPNILIRSRANSTLQKYDNYFSQWESWAVNFNEITPFPAESIYVSLYLTSLIQENKSYSVIESTLFAIKHYHVFAGAIDPTCNALVNYIAEAAKRMNNRQTKKKEPLLFEHLTKIFENIGKKESTLLDFRNFTLMVVSFAGFLRYSEVSNLTLGDIVFEPTFMRLFIEQSKTDQYREGHWVFIAKTVSEICPVKTLNMYITRAGIELHDEFLFRGLSFFKSKGIHKLRKKNKPISYSTARLHVLDLIKGIGLNEKLFGLHSLRSGGATEAARNGVPDRLFQNHGRWKSEKIKDGYVRDKLEDLLRVSLNLGFE